jgi:hypothetical protein
MDAMTFEAPEWASNLFPEAPLDFVRRTEPMLHYEKIGDSLVVIVSARVEADGKRWMHVSCSRPNRLPTWDDLRRVKDVFIGKNRKAIQVMPPASEYVNIAKFALHLWCCLDGDGLPDFRTAGMI